ncbi:MAG TPA: hypothetical protein VF292_02790 [Rhodanobacteraceae bacterium]
MKVFYAMHLACGYAGSDQAAERGERCDGLYITERNGVHIKRRGTTPIAVVQPYGRILSERIDPVTSKLTVQHELASCDAELLGVVDEDATSLRVNARMFYVEACREAGVEPRGVMTKRGIVDAVSRGDRVFWRSPAYEVIRDRRNAFLIAYRHGVCENYVGLTHTDGETLNGENWEFVRVLNPTTGDHHASL